MQEVLYYPVAGDKRGGTGYRCYGGFAYGCNLGDAVTLQPDRPTDLFAPSLTTQVEEAAAHSDGDRWVDRTPIENGAHSRGVWPFATQPATNALTAKQQGGVLTTRIDLKNIPWKWVGVGAVLCWIFKR